MIFDCSRRGKRARRLTNGVLGLSLALALCGVNVRAQTEATSEKTTSEKATSESVETFHLTNISQPNDAIEIVTAVRNLLKPDAKIYFVPNQNALILHTTPDQIKLAQKLLSDLDRPKRTYRLTYTITETDGDKRIGTQHFSFVVVSGQRTTLKQGSKVPVATGTYSTGTSGVQTQFTYLDIGLNFDATLDESVNGVRLRTKAEQSSIAEQKTVADVQEPVVRQTVLEGTAILTPGKPLVLGTLDIPSTTRHQDIEVVMEIVR